MEIHLTNVMKTKPLNVRVNQNNKTEYIVKYYSVQNTIKCIQFVKRNGGPIKCLLTWRNQRYVFVGNKIVHDQISARNALLG
jgi:hypothetical protein